MIAQWTRTIYCFFFFFFFFYALLSKSTCFVILKNKKREWRMDFSFSLIWHVVGIGIKLFLVNVFAAFTVSKSLPIQPCPVHLGWVGMCDARTTFASFASCAELSATHYTIWLKQSHTSLVSIPISTLL